MVFRDIPAFFRAYWLQGLISALCRDRPWFMMSDMTRSGIGYDAHRLADGRLLVLGGEQIDHPLGLLGHSDADVLTHALMDAILGAVGGGDIGGRFPDHDPRYKNARSLDLLSGMCRDLRGDGWLVNNTDATVLAEEPKLAPYIAAMRRNLARAMSVDIDRVSVKATTVEGMGALGRREGIAAMATATMIKEVK